MLSDRFSPKTPLKRISWSGLTKPLVAVSVLLLVLLSFGIVRIPWPFLAITLSAFLVLVFPGYLLSGLIFSQPLPWPNRVALSFALSAGLWLIPSSLVLWFRGNLTIVIGVMLGVTLVLAVITLLRPRPAQSTEREQGSEEGAATPDSPTGTQREWSRMIYWVALGVCLVLILAVSASTNAPFFTDRTFEQAFLRHFLDSDQFLSEGFRISPSLINVTARDFTHGWGVLLGMVIRLAQVEMLDAYVYFLPLLLIAIAFLAFYTLASELLENWIAVLSACLVQAIYVLADIPDHEGIGRSLFVRIMQDKLAMRFLILPVAFWLTLRYIKRGEKASLISLIIVIIALALVHPLGAAMYGISFVLLLLVRLLFGSWSKKREMLIQALPIIIVILVMLLIPLAERQLMATFDSAEHLLGDVEENITDLRAEHVLMLGGGLGLYIANPGLIAHPLVILALLLTPLLLLYLRTRLSAQFLFSNMVGAMFLCYTPFVASMLGILVTPWLIWRVLWLLPVALVIGFFLGEVARLSVGHFRSISPQLLQLIPLGIILAGALIFGPQIKDGIDSLVIMQEERALTAEQRELFSYFREEGEPGSVILTPSARLSNEIPGLVGHSFGITFREAPTLYPSAEHDRAGFYGASLVTGKNLDILQRYDIRYVVLNAASVLTEQLNGLSGMFKPVYTNDKYEVFEVSSDLAENPVITGNMHLIANEWELAMAAYNEALSRDADDALAHLGIAQVYQAQGNMQQAVLEYRKAFLSAPELLHAGLIRQISQDMNIDPIYLPAYLAQGDDYRAGQEADLQDSTWATRYLLDSLDSAKISDNDLGAIYKSAFIVEQVPKGVLFQHPPSQISFPLHVPSPGQLNFSLALAPEAWPLGNGDGVEFSIYIDDGDTRWKPFSEYIDPKNIPAHRRWHDRELDLSLWASQTVTLTFSTDPGPNRDDRYDWAGWGEPRFVQPVAYDFLAELPNADLGGANEEEVRQVILAIGHEPRATLRQVPSTRATYRVDVPESASLHFGLGMDPAIWSPDKGDGMEYNIYVRELDGPAVLHQVFSRYIDPKHNPEDRQWLDQVVDLSAYGAQTLEVILEVLPGPAGDASYDWGGWSTPVLLEKMGP